MLWSLSKWILQIGTLSKSGYMLTLFGNMFFMHQWLMSFMCVRLPFVEWLMCWKWLLLQWTNKISSEMPSKLSFVYQHFLFFVHYLPTTQRRQFWNVNFWLLLVPSIQHWYGKRSMWLWKVHIVIESYWIFGSIVSTNGVGLISMLAYVQAYSNFYYLNSSLVMNVDYVLKEYRKANLNTYFTIQ